MVVAAFPLAKLGALVLKQVAKPLANLVKSRAKSSPFFRTYVCMPPAQFYHWCEVKMKMWSMNLGKPVNIPKLNENMAIELGAELLGEGIIFVIAAGVLVFEFTRSSRKESSKELERIAELAQIQNELKELYFAKAQQETQLREIIRILKINVPTQSFAPLGIDQSSIPDHHRDDYERQEDASTYTVLKGWLWSAIDVILPPVDGGEQEKETRHVIVVTAPPPPPPNNKDNNNNNNQSSGPVSSSSSSSSSPDTKSPATTKGEITPKR